METETWIWRHGSSRGPGNIDLAMDLVVANLDIWIWRKGSVKDPGRWTLQRSCNTDRVEDIEAWILQPQAAEDPRHRFFVKSLSLMWHENADIDSCEKCSCVL